MQFSKSKEIPKNLRWAHLDLNQEPLPYQDSALTR